MVQEGNHRSLNRTGYCTQKKRTGDDIARLDQNALKQCDITSIIAGKRSRDFCHQFWSDEGNLMAFYQQKALPH